MDALVASSSLPMVTRGKVKFRGEWMFDGGYSDPLPLDKAIGDGWSTHLGGAYQAHG